MTIVVPALAKINLDLRVVHKRPDNFHELRTVFQTISLADQIRVEFNPAKRTSLVLESSIEIADNLVLRAAKLVLERLKLKAAVRFRLTKQIPMGAGLGGGSSDAAAVLMALPALAGRALDLLELLEISEQLGSDVPFFLYGGTALAVGRGTEVYPLADQPAHTALIVATGIHVSTTEAYGRLGREGATALTSPADSRMLREFQSAAWRLTGAHPGQLPLKNDFEPGVFKRHPELAKVARKLRQLGAQPVLMTGSGSAIFGVFRDRTETSRAASQFAEGTTYQVRFVGRRQYRSLWRRALGSIAGSSHFASPWF